MEDRIRMRLKKLIVHGFKSFADRTEFVFDAPITGIVGPNGCGKSNVVDAFKWVLGEQSAKSLRGDAMLDVIFNGAESRKPAAMAEVTLVFDNPKDEEGKRLLVLDLDEVAVGRRLYRDGTSEYQLNGQGSRLRDVRDLFLDTGVGVDAYSVIEQGRVAALLDSNPQERRLIFEEAAGISKYKVRKKEAERKLERVEQNLLRATDIVEEVEKRLRGVRVQAGRARVYKEYTERLGELRLALSLKNYHELNEEMNQSQGRIDDARFRLDDAAGDLARRQNEHASARERQEQAVLGQQRCEMERLQAEASQQSARQSQEHAQEQLGHVDEQVAGLERDLEAVRGRVEQTRQTLAEEKRRLESLSAELEQKRGQIESRQQEHKQQELELARLSESIEQQRTTALDLMRQIAAVSSRISAIEIELANIAQQQSRLGERRKVVAAEAEALGAAQASIQAELDAAVANLAAIQQAAAAKRDEAQNLDAQIGRVSEALGTAKEHRSGLVSRQTLLADLENRREGMSDGVKAVLRQRGEKYPFVRGLVADLLRVDLEHAPVIEAALDGRDQMLVTNGSLRNSSQQASIEELAGRVSFLHPEELKNSQGSAAVPNGARSVMELVRFEPGDEAIVRHLLGQTFVVPALADAVALREQGAVAGVRFVTRNCEVLEADGTLRAGPLTASMAILSRRSELTAVAGQIQEVDGRIAELTRQLDAGTSAAKAAQEELTELRSKTYQASTVKVELASKLAQTQDKLAAARREQPVLDHELEGLAAAAGRLSEEEGRLAGQRGELEARHVRCQEQGEAAATEHERIAEALRRGGEELTALRVEVGQVQEKQLAAEQSVARQNAGLEELAQQIRRIEESLATCRRRSEDLEAELQEAQRQEEVTQERLAELAEKVAGFVAAVAEAQKQVAALAAGVEEKRQAHAQAEHDLHAAEMRCGELRVRVESLVQRGNEELQIDLPARYGELAAAEGGYKPDDRDWSAVGSEIQELRDKVMKLGNVNLDSIGEQDELEQRRSFLQTQLDDLVGSQKQLTELIDTINAESAERFEKAFNAVREHFQGMFRKLFGGGKADVYLETELAEQGAAVPAGAAEAGEAGAAEGIANEAGALAAPKKVDILDAGIEIIARPPGKQPVTINQLSGGEKTMTCVALLLSIFKSKPSPFCILDEVDAALDEANNQRFNLIVQEFLEQSQFIIITHSKRTMEIADQLYGVTMQEQGVSKRVAVKFEHVDHHGRITETAAA
jgi:chromosome segregation protein